MQDLSLLEIATRLGSAVTLGTLVGLERQWRQRLTGLRTNVLVALGAASFTLFAALTPGDASPTRVASQVVSGIGFLGAGVILRDGMKVRGLNSAATLWCVAAVGVLCGAGMFFVALIATALIFAANVSLRPLAHALDRFIPHRSSYDQLTRYLVQVTTMRARESHIRTLILQASASSRLQLERLESEPRDGDGERVTISAQLRADAPQLEPIEALVARLSLEQEVTGARWSKQGDDDDDD